MYKTACQSRLIYKALILNIILFFSCLVFGQSSEIKKAAELRKNGKSQEALRILKQAEKEYKNNPVISYEIALTYLKIDDIKERMYASDYLERAMKADPENAKYMLTYAKLKKRQGFGDTAEKILLKISEMNSNNTEVLVEVAEIYLEQAIWHERMKKIYSDNDARVPVIIRLDEFAQNNFKRADNIFNRVLEIEPDNSDALYNLGRLYFFQKNWIKMQELFSKAVKSRPDFKDAHLFLGYTYYLQKDYENAFKHFEEAKKYMSEDEIAVMESFDRVFYDNAEIDPAYWTQRNPSFLTEINLRKLEHYARLAYANLHYTKPDMNLAGWKSERGQVVVRFGEPRFSSKTAPEIDVKVLKNVSFNDPSYKNKKGVVEGLKGPIPKGYISSKTGDGYFKFATESWAYENFVLNFEDRYLSRNFTLNNNSKWVYDQIIKKTPERYNHPFKNIKFDFPYYYAVFKDEDKLQLDVYYSIPKDSIKIKIAGVENFSILQGCFLMNENWDKIGKSVSEIELKNPHGKDIVSAVGMKINSGKYILAVEFWEKNNRFFGQEKFPVDIKAFENELCISDIIIGIPSDGKPDKKKGKAFQNGILPRPNLEFTENKIRVFLEVYNLTLAGGSSNFKVITSISTQKKKKKGFAKLAESFINIFRGKIESEISNSYTYHGDSINDIIVLNVDIASLKPGKYDLNIELTDLTGKTNTKTNRSFLVK